MTSRRQALTFLIACALPLAASAQDFPRKPIKLVVPWTAGSATDAVARHIAEGLHKSLGVPTSVENRPGASGMPGTDVVAKSEPDGHTLLVAVTSHVTNPILFKSRIPYDTDRQFAPISLLATTPAVLFAGPQLKAQSLVELVSQAKANPGKLVYASSGTGNTPHLTAELFKLSSGVQIEHVPYKGGAATIPDLVGGHIPLAVSLMGTFSGVYKEGRVRALAIASPQRVAWAPNVPTFAELGFPDVVGDEWFGILAPAKTPKAVIDKLNREIERILAQPDTKERFDKLGVDVAGGSPEQFQSFMDTAKKRWMKVIEGANIQIP